MLMLYCSSFSFPTNTRHYTTQGYSVLHIAAEMGYTDIIQTILQEIPSLRAPAHHHFRWTADDRTAIQLAVASGVHEAVAVLLADGEIDANYPDQV